MATTAEVIKACAADKLQIARLPEDLLLVEVKSSGERVVFKDNDVSVPTALSLNGRIFVSPKDHLDALVMHDSSLVRTRETHLIVIVLCSMLFATWQTPQPMGLITLGAHV